MDSGSYLNTERCAEILNRASLDARYLGLIPSDALVDRRNDEPTIYLNAEEDAGGIEFAGGLDDYMPPSFTVPRLELNLPTIAQRYHLEIWCEKSTMNDVLVPLCERFGINLVTGVGELSHTRCVQLVERAINSGRPVRILYISDFDPAGASMPVAVARKIKHLLHQGGQDLDIQVRPVVLTFDQCRQYRLPRTPIKESEHRGAAFEARFGEGATELDALEALHPGELERILTREINRYFDDDLDGLIDEVGEEVQADLDDINDKVRQHHAKAIKALEAERKQLLAAIKAFEKKTKPVMAAIEADLEAEAPDLDSYSWPEPDDGDEDDDPLFNSTRDYLEQIDRFKAHQGKSTEARERRKPTKTARVCPVCKKTFLAANPRATTCSEKCRGEKNRARNSELQRQRRAKRRAPKAT